MPEDRRHAAIMFTDIVGYTALMGSDEDQAFDMLTRNRKIHMTFINEFNGTLIKEIGDGILASFSLSSDAVRCAINIQKECKVQNIPLRIGIHEGETVFAGADVFGDGVNIASRLQGESQKGGIIISDSVYRNIKNKTDLRTKFIKEKSLKNVDEPIKIHQVIWEEGKELAHGRSPKSKYWKNLSYILAGIVVVTLVILVLRPYLGHDTDIPGEKSIAVLPFENQSEDNEYAYFGDALTDEIIMQLLKIKDFKVRSKTSVMKYKSTDETITDIAEELKVNYIIEGTAQRFGNQVRIRVQLIQSKSDDHLWGKVYEREWTDIFKLQSDIAMELAGELETILTPEEIEEIERNPTENLEAYEYYMKASKFHTGFSWNYTDSEISNAVIFYQKALDLDPHFGLAYVGLGCAKFNQTYWDEYYKENFGDSLLWYVNKALSINPDLPEALLWKGMYYFVKGDNDSALIQYQKILDKQPNHSFAYWWMGMSQADDGKYLEAIMSYKKANELLTGDPQYGTFLSYYFLAYLGIMDFENAEKKARERMDYNMLHGLINLEVLYYTTGEIEKEEEIVNKICAMDSNLHCIGDISYVYAKQGKYDQAFEYFKKYESMRDVPDIYGLGEINRKAYLLIKLDRREEAEAILHKEIDHYLERLKLGRALEASAKFNLAACYALLGEKEKAYDILYKLEEKGFHGHFVSNIQVDPLFENLWDDKEFMAIIRRQEKKYADIRAEVARLEAGI